MATLPLLCPHARWESQKRADIAAVSVRARGERINYVLKDSAVMLTGLKTLQDGVCFGKPETREIKTIVAMGLRSRY